MWIRNPATNHGNVFVGCTFETPTRPNPLGRVSNPALARLPNNHGVNYPYAEAVLINCRLKGIPPEGWGPIEEAPAFDHSNVHLWEYNTMDLDRRPADVSKRHPVSKQLTMEKDAKTIADYSNPAFVLGGWTPVVAP